MENIVCTSFVPFGYWCCCISKISQKNTFKLNMLTENSDSSLRSKYKRDVVTAPYTPVICVRLYINTASLLICGFALEYVCARVHCSRDVYLYRNICKWWHARWEPVTNTSQHRRHTICTYLLMELSGEWKRLWVRR